MDIKAQEFWNKSRSSTFFDVRVFNPHAPSNGKSTTAACYRKHEVEKRSKYERRVLDVEHGSFTLLVSPQVEAGGLLPQSHSEGWPASSPTRCHNLIVHFLASSAARLHSHWLTRLWCAYMGPDPQSTTPPGTWISTASHWTSSPMRPSGLCDLLDNCFILPAIRQC